ncbi:hypothetical protein Agub_g6359, partial [Astrephomene gubernaculifera]
MAFGCLKDAIAWACHLQKELLHLPWPPALLQMPGCEEVLGGGGQRLWCGLRVRVGMAHGYINVKKPMNTGRADYFGELANTAARVAALAAPGQILVESSQVVVFMPDGTHLLSGSYPTYLPVNWAAANDEPRAAVLARRHEAVTDGGALLGYWNAGSGAAGSRRGYGSDRIRRASYGAGQMDTLGDALHDLPLATPFQRVPRSVGNGVPEPAASPATPLAALMTLQSRRRISLLDVTARSLSTGAQHLLAARRKSRTDGGGMDLRHGSGCQVDGPSDMRVEYIELRALGKFLLRGLDNPKLLFQALPESLLERTFPIPTEALVSMPDASLTMRAEMPRRVGLLALLWRTAGQVGELVAGGATRGALAAVRGRTAVAGGGGAVQLRGAVAGAGARGATVPSALALQSRKTLPGAVMDEALLGARSPRGGSRRRSDVSALTSRRHTSMFPRTATRFPSSFLPGSSSPRGGQGDVKMRASGSGKSGRQGRGGLLASSHSTSLERCKLGHVPLLRSATSPRRGLEDMPPFPRRSSVDLSRFPSMLHHYHHHQQQHRSPGDGAYEDAAELQESASRPSTAGGFSGEMGDQPTSSTSPSRQLRRSSPGHVAAAAADEALRPLGARARLGSSGQRSEVATPGKADQPLEPQPPVSCTSGSVNPYSPYSPPGTSPYSPSCTAVPGGRVPPLRLARGSSGTTPCRGPDATTSAFQHSNSNNPLSDEAMQLVFMNPLTSAFTTPRDATVSPGAMAAVAMTAMAGAGSRSSLDGQYFVLQPQLSVNSSTCSASQTQGQQRGGSATAGPAHVAGVHEIGSDVGNTGSGATADAGPGSREGLPTLGLSRASMEAAGALHLSSTSPRSVPALSRPGSLPRDWMRAPSPLGGGSVVTAVLAGGGTAAETHGSAAAAPLAAAAGATVPEIEAVNPIYEMPSITARLPVSRSGSEGDMGTEPSSPTGIIGSLAAGAIPAAPLEMRHHGSTASLKHLFLDSLAAWTQKPTLFPGGKRSRTQQGISSSSGTSVAASAAAPFNPITMITTDFGLTGDGDGGNSVVFASTSPTPPPPPLPALPPQATSGHPGGLLSDLRVRAVLRAASAQAVAAPTDAGGSRDPSSAGDAAGESAGGSRPSIGGAALRSPGRGADEPSLHRQHQHTPATPATNTATTTSRLATCTRTPAEGEEVEQQPQPPSPPQLQSPSSPPQQSLSQSQTVWQRLRCMYQHSRDHHQQHHEQEQRHTRLSRGRTLDETAELGTHEELYCDNNSTPRADAAQEALQQQPQLTSAGMCTAAAHSLLPTNVARIALSHRVSEIHTDASGGVVNNPGDPGARGGRAERAVASLLRGVRLGRGVSTLGGASVASVYSPPGSARSHTQQRHGSPVPRFSGSSSGSSLYSGTASPRVTSGGVEPGTTNRMTSLLAAVFGRGQHARRRHARFRRRSTHIFMNDAARMELLQRSAVAPSASPEADAGDAADSGSHSFAAAVALTYVQHRRQQQHQELHSAGVSMCISNTRDGSGNVMKDSFGLGWSLGEESGVTCPRESFGLATEAQAPQSQAPPCSRSPTAATSGSLWSGDPQCLHPHPHQGVPVSPVAAALSTLPADFCGGEGSGSPAAPSNNPLADKNANSSNNNDNGPLAYARRGIHAMYGIHGTSNHNMNAIAPPSDSLSSVSQTALAMAMAAPSSTVSALGSGRSLHTAPLSQEYQAATPDQLRSVGDGSSAAFEVLPYIQGPTGATGGGCGGAVMTNKDGSTSATATPSLLPAGLLQRYPSLACDTPWDADSSATAQQQQQYPGFYTRLSRASTLSRSGAVGGENALMSSCSAAAAVAAAAAAAALSSPFEAAAAQKQLPSWHAGGSPCAPTTAALPPGALRSPALSSHGSDSMQLQLQQQQTGYSSQQDLLLSYCQQPSPTAVAQVSPVQARQRRQPPARCEQRHTGRGLGKVPSAAYLDVLHSATPGVPHGAPAARFASPQAAASAQSMSPSMSPPSSAYAAAAAAAAAAFHSAPDSPQSSEAHGRMLRCGGGGGGVLQPWSLHKSPSDRTAVEIPQVSSLAHWDAAAAASGPDCPATQAAAAAATVPILTGSSDGWGGQNQGLRAAPLSAASAASAASTSMATSAAMVSPRGQVVHPHAHLHITGSTILCSPRGGSCFEASAVVPSSSAAASGGAPGPQPSCMLLQRAELPKSRRPSVLPLTADGGLGLHPTAAHPASHQRSNSLQSGPRVIQAALAGPSHPLYYNAPMSEWAEPEAVAAVTAAAAAAASGNVLSGSGATRRIPGLVRKSTRLLHVHRQPHHQQQQAQQAPAQQQDPSLGPPPSPGGGPTGRQGQRNSAPLPSRHATQGPSFWAQQQQQQQPDLSPRRQPHAQQQQQPQQHLFNSDLSCPRDISSAQHLYHQPHHHQQQHHGAHWRPQMEPGLSSHDWEQGGRLEAAAGAEAASAASDSATATTWHHHGHQSGAFGAVEYSAYMPQFEFQAGDPRVNDSWTQGLQGPGYDRYHQWGQHAHLLSQHPAANSAATAAARLTHVSSFQGTTSHAQHPSPALNTPGVMRQSFSLGKIEPWPLSPRQPPVLHGPPLQGWEHAAASPDASATTGATAHVASEETQALRAILTRTERDLVAQLERAVTPEEASEIEHILQQIRRSRDGPTHGSGSPSQSPTTSAAAGGSPNAASAPLPQHGEATTRLLLPAQHPADLSAEGPSSPEPTSPGIGGMPNEETGDTSPLAGAAEAVSRAPRCASEAGMEGLVTENKELGVAEVSHGAEQESAPALTELRMLEAATSAPTSQQPWASAPPGHQVLPSQKPGPASGGDQLMSASANVTAANDDSCCAVAHPPLDEFTIRMVQLPSRGSRRDNSTGGGTAPSGALGSPIGLLLLEHDDGFGSPVPSFEVSSSSNLQDRPSLGGAIIGSIGTGTLTGPMQLLAAPTLSHHHHHHHLAAIGAGSSSLHSSGAGSLASPMSRLAANLRPAGAGGGGGGGGAG